MLGSDDAWRWIISGLGGATGMLANLHQDASANRCPEEWLAKLEQYASQLTIIAQEQKGSPNDPGDS